MQQARTPTSRAVGMLGTVLGRVRCVLPAQVARMRHSLTTHGQMTPVVAVERSGGLELVDGFKRRAAALAMGWDALTVSVTVMDERAQWAAMLALNRGPRSMTELEEALVLRELVATGLTQTEVAALVGRHKSWVSRRIGLVERLHPELVEQVKVGVIEAGVARRLLALPQGNQPELAAVAGTAALGPRDTELLVGLWQRARDPEVRRYLLTEPRAAIAHAYPERRPAPADPRLTPAGQRLWRLLCILRGVLPRTLAALEPALAASDRLILAEEQARTAEWAGRVASALGSPASCASAAASGAAAATS